MGALGTFVEVAARPQPFRLATATTAVVVVDMQNDFASPGGMFDRAGIDITGIRAIVPKVHAVLAAARYAGLTIVYLKMGFSPDLADAGYPSSPTWLKHLPLGPATTSLRLMVNRRDTCPGLLEHRHRPGAVSGRRRHRALQDALQRLLCH